MDFIPVRPDLSLLAVFGYALFAFLFGLTITPWFISFLHRNKLGKKLRVETVDGREASVFLQYHQHKFGTPTMGGLLIWGSILATVVFSRLLAFLGTVDHSLFSRGQVYLPLFILVSLGILGAMDDYFNIVGEDEAVWKSMAPTLRKIAIGTIAVLIVGVVTVFYGLDLEALGFSAVSAVGGASGKFSIAVVPIVLLAFLILSLFLLLNATIFVDRAIHRFLNHQGKKRGLTATSKLSSLLIVGLVAACWFYFKLGYNEIHIPFWGNLVVGMWYIPIFLFIMTATANAVNFTDGLDGLAGGLLVIAFGSFAVLAYVSELFLLAGFCAVCVGAIAAFLWHNVPPALFYMGDTGSLALGGTLGVIAMMIDQMLLIPLVGFVFVLEIASVVIQLTSKKLRNGKKVFRCAPIHHHFEALEWGESKVTMRLWIIGAFFAFAGIVVGIFG